jgi:hypothetical protein
MGIPLHFYKTSKVLGLFPTKTHIPSWDLDVVSVAEGFEIKSIHEKGKAYNVFKEKSLFFCHTNGGFPRSFWSTTRAITRR